MSWLRLESGSSSGGVVVGRGQKFKDQAVGAVPFHSSTVGASQLLSLPALGPSLGTPMTTMLSSTLTPPVGTPPPRPLDHIK